MTEGRKKKNSIEMAIIHQEKKQLRALVEMYRKRNPEKTIKDLGEELDPPVSQGTMSRWLSDKYNATPSTEHFKTIVEKSGGDPDALRKGRLDFFASDINDLDKSLKVNIIPLVNEYGISTEFLSFLKDIKGYDDSFPLWTPMTRNANEDSYYNILRCPVEVLTGHPKSEQYPFLQVKANDGEYKNYSDNDLLFLSVLQKKVVDLINQELEDRRSQLDRNVAVVSTIEKNQKAKVTDATVRYIDDSLKGLFPYEIFVDSDDDHIHAKPKDPEALTQLFANMNHDSKLINKYREEQNREDFMNVISEDNEKGEK